MTEDGSNGSGRFVVGAVRSFATGTPCPELPGDLGWLDVARRAHVVPPVISAVRAAGATLGPALRELRMEGAATQLRACAELGVVARCLDASSVRWVVVKGPALGEAVYRVTASRSYGDLDVLVHPEDLGGALDTLVAAGFLVMDRNWDLVARSGRGEIAVLTPSGYVLDLHWHPVNSRPVRSQLGIDVRGMIARRTVVDVAGVQAPTLDALDTVVYVALHAVLSGGHQLKWMLDLHQAVQRLGSGADQLGARAREHGLGLVVGVGLDHASRWVDPALAAHASAVTPRSSWTALCEQVSERCPPLGVAPGRRTGRAVFSSTRRGSATSMTAALGAAAVAQRDRVKWLDRSVPVQVLRREGGTAADRARWIELAAASS